MSRAAARFTGCYRTKLQVLLQERVQSGQWTSVPAILMLLARFRWLSLRSRVRARFWRMINRRSTTANRAEPPVHHRDQSTSKLEVAE